MRQKIKIKLTKTRAVGTSRAEQTKKYYIFRTVDENFKTHITYKRQLGASHLKIKEKLIEKHIEEQEH